ncbi:MAG: glycosyltransferase [Patescibacteria group bacterium]
MSTFTDKNLRILVANPLWPQPHHLEAANVILFELIRELAQQPNVQVGYLKVSREGEPAISNTGKEGLDALRKVNVDIVEPLHLPQRRHSTSVFRKIFLPRLRDVYPDTIYRPLIEKAVMSYQPDVLIVPASEWLTALCADIPVVKFAYYGNPDPKSLRAMAKFDFDKGMSSPLRYIAKKVFANHLEHFHIIEMKKYEILGDLAANDAEYYVKKGHANAFYINNVWIDRYPSWRTLRKSRGAKDLVKIVGNIGRLSATANTHGLEILGRDVLPALEQTMKGYSYEVHLFGRGELHPALVKYFKRPEVRIRGFVDDIDGELLSSDIFLCMNNASAYKVGHTRYLHAWSLGCCVVAHADAALSMPEIIHGENALLGKTPVEIANLIKMAIEDPILRNKISEGGYKTFKQYFTAANVATKVIGAINAYRQIYVR